MKDVGSLCCLRPGHHSIYVWQTPVIQSNQTFGELTPKDACLFIGFALAVGGDDQRGFVYAVVLLRGIIGYVDDRSLVTCW